MRGPARWPFPFATVDEVRARLGLQPDPWADIARELARLHRLDREGRRMPDAERAEAVRRLTLSFGMMGEEVADRLRAAGLAVPDLARAPQPGPPPAPPTGGAGYRTAPPGLARAPRSAPAPRPRPWHRRAALALLGAFWRLLGRPRP